MRIGITGSHCVGKTTLSNELMKRIGYPLIIEQVKRTVNEFNELGIDSVESMTASKWYDHMMFDIFRRQIIEESENENFLSDRTTLDYFVYYKLIKGMQTPIVDLFDQMFTEHYMKGYDFVIYIPIMFDLVDNGFRNMDDDFRHLVDGEIKRLSSQHSNVLIIESDNLDKRVDQVMDYIEKMKAVI